MIPHFAVLRAAGRIPGRRLLAGALALLLLLLGAGPSRADAQILVVTFRAASGEDPADIGRIITDGLIFQLQTDKGLTTVPRAQAEEAREGVLLQQNIDAISPADALRLAQDQQATYAVWGTFLKQGDRIQVDAFLGSLATRKVYRIKLQGNKLIDTQDELAKEVQKLLRKDVKVLAEEEQKAKQQVKEAPAVSEAELALREEISKMSPAEREKAAIQEFNKGVQVGDNSDTEKDHYEKALLYKPDYAGAYYNLGVLNTRRKDWEGATKHLRRFVELSPQDPNVPAIKKAIAAAEEEMAKQAMKKADIAFNPTPEQQEWSGAEWFNAALEIENQPALALEYYRQAVRKQPDLAPAWYNLGTIYYQRDQNDEALEAFEKYLESAPKSDPDRKTIENLVKRLEVGGY